MKYLRHINEINIEFYDELKEFCSNYLSYLKDLGYTYEFREIGVNLHIIIQNKNSLFANKLGDLVEDLSQFQQILNITYKVYLCTIFLSDNKNTLPDSYTVLENDLSNDYFINKHKDKYLSQIRFVIDDRYKNF